MQRMVFGGRFPSETVSHDGHRRKGKGNVMALVHPGKPRALAYERSARVSKPMHPAFGLLMGFALLLFVALGVHFLFGLF
ncbi:hypothetical protein OB03_07915 [Brevundimonas sp. GN22]|uniref:hypothetical protein n=1 Tax=Brevundimonas pishanensis TaxID=2896315 RepID=UPI001FA6FB0D|nr:hypothetical protein [Brevundimonas pishanensis]